MTRAGSVNGAAGAPVVSGAVVRPGMRLVRAGGPVAVPRMGLQLSQRLPFEAWLDIGRQLSTAATSMAWCLGDWLAYGQKTYEGRYREAVERTGLDYQTLRNYAWIARRFEMPRRRETLSFGHHAELASLPEPEQDFWLRKAEQLSWSTSQLRREVRASLAERSNGQEKAGLPHSNGPGDLTQPSAHERPADSEVIEVRLTREQSQLCEQAAHRYGLSLPAWAAQTLNCAARDKMQT